MGQHDVASSLDAEAVRHYQRTLLDELEVLEKLLEGSSFETGVSRIGAEQELFLVDAQGDPAPEAEHVLSAARDPRLTTEIALFNLEANLTPIEFGGSCLGTLRRELDLLLAKTKSAALESGARVATTGILPTLRREHLDMKLMTPSPRYHALVRAAREQRSDDFRVHINGIDELEIEHSSLMLESFNTSFQLHYQVAPKDFARLYNLAQLVTAPVLAAAANAPLLLGHRLWAETRVALFQQSVDVRDPAMRMRESPLRVLFGDRWVKASILELFRENLERHRVLLLPPAALTSSRDEFLAGTAPSLAALRLHNGTVYRWTRPCYGNESGVPHVRLEARAFPSGPTTVDAVANAALFYGLLASEHEYGDVSAQLEFSAAKENFFFAARHGLRANLRWVDGETHSARALLVGQLIPMASRGLKRAGLDAAEVDFYLGVMEQRVRSGQNGAEWIRKAYEALGGTPDERLHALVAEMIARQEEGAPVHTWTLPDARTMTHGAASHQTVGQFMTTDLFTVRAEDALELALSLMKWEHIRHLPVEGEGGVIVGMVSLEDALPAPSDAEPASRSVRDIMRPCGAAVAPDTPTRKAIAVLREAGLTALPVIRDDRLVGIVTEHDLLKAATALLSDQ